MFLSRAAARLAGLNRTRAFSVAFTLEQLPLLTRGLTAETLLSNAVRPIRLRLLKYVKAASDRFPVNPELVSETRLE
jgi:hypothetical protein